MKYIPRLRINNTKTSITSELLGRIIPYINDVNYAIETKKLNDEFYKSINYIEAYTDAVIKICFSMEMNKILNNTFETFVALRENIELIRRCIKDETVSNSNARNND